MIETEFVVKITTHSVQTPVLQNLLISMMKDKKYPVGTIKQTIATA